MASTQIITKEHCESLIKTQINNELFRILNYQTQPILEVNSLCESEKFYLECEIKLEQTDNVKTMRYFVKRKLKNVNNETSNSFEREKLFYVNNGEENCAWAPRMYDLYDEQLLILDDLTQQGFKSTTTACLDLQHCKLAISTLAKFHAFYFKQKEPKFDTKKLEDKQIYSDVHVKYLYDLLELLPNPKLPQSELKQRLNEKFVKLHKDLQPSVKYPNVCTHGNLQQSNIMFQYDEMDNVCDCRFVDYKFCKYVPPIFDLLFFIFSNTTQEFQQKYFARLLDYYYKKLTEYLATYELDIKDIFNRADYLLAIQDYMTTVKIIVTLNFLIVNNNSKHKDKLQHLAENLQEILVDDRIYRENCYEIMNKKLNNSDYKLVDFFVKPISKKVGYLGEHQLLTINVQWNDDVENNPYYFFVKFLPTEGGYLDLLNSLQGFDREILFYAEIFDKMKLLNINTINEVIPEFYLARKNRFLIFDDLTQQGYKMRNKYDQLDFAHFKCFLKSLARLHAASVIYEERMTQLLGREFRIFDIAPHIFTEPIYKTGGVLVGGFNGIQFVHQKYFPEYHVDDFKEKLDRTIPIFLSRVERSTKYRNVLCHGDLWTNNIMFRYNDQNEPINCRLVDFQLGRQIPQANDVMAAIHLMINRHMREKNFQDLQQIYFEDFCTELRNYGVDYNDVISFQEFLKCCEEMDIFACTQKACQYHFIMMDPIFEDSFCQNPEKQRRALHCDRSELIEENWNISAAYRAMMRDSHIPIFEFYQNWKL